MMNEIFFILHVVNGIHKIFHNVIWYIYTNSYSNNSVNIPILVQILFSENITTE